MTLQSVRRFALGAAVLLALGPACARPKPPPPPPPDPDGRPEQAQLVEPDLDHGDSLNRGANDLDDWYRLDLPSDGRLFVTVSGSTEGGAPEYFVAVTDTSGERILARERAGGRERFALELKKVDAGPVLVWVGSQPETTTPIGYQLNIDYTPVRKPAPKKVEKKPAPTAPLVREPAPAPPPPPPKFEKVTAGVVETSKAPGGSQSLTIAAGANRGVQTGNGGRLVDSGRVIGTFTVMEVYAKGSKVRVNGSLSGAVTSGTVAEVDVPTGGTQ
jgi:hypothetical protein